MRKHDRAGLRLKTRAFWESACADRNLGFGLSYSEHPPRPYGNPVAYLLRQSIWFYDAVQEWAVGKIEPSSLVTSKTHLELFSAEKQRCATVIRAALGRYRDDFGSAERAMDEWCSSARSAAGLITGNEQLRPEHLPLMNTVWEINRTLRPLLEAYRSPKKFFRELAPGLFSHDFDFPKGDWQQLTGTLHSWGYGALLNPTVRAAFDAAAEDPRTFAKVLGLAEGRKAYVEGRRKGTRDGQTSTRRVPHAKRSER